MLIAMLLFRTDRRIRAIVVGMRGGKSVKSSSWNSFNAHTGYKNTGIGEHHHLMYLNTNISWLMGLAAGWREFATLYHGDGRTRG
jgi:hypothetical protein